MEDFFGFILFIVFLAFSLGGKLMRRRPRSPVEEEEDNLPPRQAQPQWPGPVAEPRIPGYPQPGWPAARPAAAPPTAAPSHQPARRPEPQTPSATRGFGTEGADMAPTMGEEIDRFSEERDQFRAESLVVEELGTLGKGSAAEVITRSVGPFQLAPARLAQAIVMAEVLGKPRALRKR